MDFQKDNKQFYKGQSGGDIPTHSSTGLVSSTGNLIPETFYHSVKKTEKLLTASYLITEHIEERDPIKMSVREVSLILVKDIYKFHYLTSQKDISSNLSKTEASLGELLALFDTCFVSKLLSEGNYLTIKKEIYTLRETLVGQFIINQSLPKGLFEGNELSLEKNTPKDDLNKNIYKGQSGKNVLYKNKLPKGQFKNTLTGKDNKKERGELIIKLLKEKGDANIKEIYDHFGDLSEKTIQRELTKMTETGAIVRKGNKRWSRYSLT